MIVLEILKPERQEDQIFKMEDDNQGYHHTTRIKFRAGLSIYRQISKFESRGAIYKSLD